MTNCIYQYEYCSEDLILHLSISCCLVTLSCLVLLREEGRSLEANVALVENNARVGAHIACAYAPMARQVKQEQARRSASTLTSASTAPAPDPAAVAEASKSPLPSPQQEEEEEFSPLPDAGAGDVPDLQDSKSILEFLKTKVTSQKRKSATLSSEELDSLWDSMHAAHDDQDKDHHLSDLAHTADIASTREGLEISGSAAFCEGAALPSVTVPAPIATSASTSSYSSTPKDPIEQLAGSTGAGVGKEDDEGSVRHAEVIVFGGAVVDQIMTPLDTTQVCVAVSVNESYDCMTMYVHVRVYYAV
jgi:hypothetical protein